MYFIKMLIWRYKAIKLFIIALLRLITADKLLEGINELEKELYYIRRYYE